MLIINLLLYTSLATNLAKFLEIDQQILILLISKFMQWIQPNRVAVFNSLLLYNEIFTRETLT